MYTVIMYGLNKIWVIYKQVLWSILAFGSFWKSACWHIFALGNHIIYILQFDWSILDLYWNVMKDVI